MSDSDAGKDTKKSLKIKKSSIVLVAIVALVALGGVFAFSSPAESSNYDEFAQCLTESGATFYGAFWCPHCNQQKALFGDAAKHVNYVECSTPDRQYQTRECITANIQSYPTWEFADGSRLTGAIPLNTLAEKTGCSLESSE